MSDTLYNIYMVNMSYVNGCKVGTYSVLEYLRKCICLPLVYTDIMGHYRNIHFRYLNTTRILQAFQGIGSYGIAWEGFEKQKAK